VILTWVVLVAGKVCAIYSPIVLGEIVTNLTASPPSDSLNLIAFYCFLSFAPTAFSELQDNLYVKVWQTAYAEVAELAFSHMHSLSLEWHLKKKMGNVVRAMDRGMTAADNIMYYAMIFLFPAVGSAIAAFVVFAVHFHEPEIAAACYLAFGMYCWITLVVTIWRRKFRSEMNKHDNRMHDIVSDSILNFEVVKCFTNEENETRRYIDAVHDYQKGNFNSQASVSVLNLSQSASIQLAMLGSLMLAAYAVVHKEFAFNPGTFVAVQNYVFTIFEPLSFLGTIYSMIINGIVDIQNLSDLISETPDIVDIPGALPFQPPAKSTDGITVEFKDVSFRYQSAGATQGVRNVSFTIPAGTTTALVGQTGSGKTTISRLLFRFYDPDQGKVMFNGQDIRRCTQKSVREQIGIVPQDTVLFNDTIRFNIHYGNLSASEEDVLRCSKLAKVHDFVERTELKYDTICGERGLKLSGGEKQRVAIARCLLKNPPIVVFDEATSALDNTTEREVQSALACLKGRTTLVIAHRLTTIQNADQILVLHDGRIVERGTHEKLLAAKGPYATMWDAQAKTPGEATGGETT
jgi:ABC-type transport system involved in Fe-S cluster assembly fused permease/ATPase subunit